MYSSLPSPVRRLRAADCLSAAELEEFLSRVTFPNDMTYPADQLSEGFKCLSGESQRLLIRAYSTGLICDDVLSREIVSFVAVLGEKWTGLEGHASFAEAVEFFDARLYSALLVIEHLGSTLDELNHSAAVVRELVEKVLNGFVGRVWGQYPKAHEYRLSPDDVPVVAAMTTYAAVDYIVQFEPVPNKPFDHHYSVVNEVFDSYPLSHNNRGTDATSLVIVHKELEILLRGRSLEEYAIANRFVRERELGTSTAEAELVIDHVAVSVSVKPLAVGIL